VRVRGGGVQVTAPVPVDAGEPTPPRKKRRSVSVTNGKKVGTKSELGSLGGREKQPWGTCTP